MPVHLGQDMQFVRLGVKWRRLYARSGLLFVRAYNVAPHVQKELVAENATYKDLVLLNMTDSYRNLFQKSYKWFEHASPHKMQVHF